MTIPTRFHDRPANVDVVTGDSSAAAEFLPHRTVAFETEAHGYAGRDETFAGEVCDLPRDVAEAWLLTRVRGSSPSTFTRWLHTDGRHIAVRLVHGDDASVGSSHKAIAASKAFDAGEFVLLADAAAFHDDRVEWVRRVRLRSTRVAYSDAVTFQRLPVRRVSRRSAHRTQILLRVWERLTPKARTITRPDGSTFPVDRLGDPDPSAAKH